MRVKFAFGRTGLETELPAGPAYQLLDPQWADALGDEAAAVGHALDHPTGCAPLAELARGRKSVAIAVCDITRPAPNRWTLPPLLGRLEQAGIKRSDITILIATGLHRPATGSEIEEILGTEIASSYVVVNHNARELADHRQLGTAQGGTPVFIDRRYVAADLHITLGFIEQHLMAGFSGGRKLIAPGLASQETIRFLHSPRFMRHRLAVEGSYEKNPLHQELLEIAEMAGHDFVLDAVLARDRKIAAVFAGDPRSAHAAGVEFVRTRTTAWIEEPACAAVTTAAGYPLDLTFYQSVKGVTAASHIVRPGGVILILAACEEGAGADEFSRLLMQSPDADAFLNSIERQPVTIDQWQLEKLALAAKSHRIWFYTPGLSRQYHQRLWGRSFANASEALEALAREAGAGARVAVIPEGPYVFSRVREQALAGA